MKKIPLTQGKFALVTEGIEVDHKDGNGLNNKKSNMRLCSRQQNCANKRVRGYSTSSRYKGVCWHKRDNNWLANISFNNKTIYIGNFDSEAGAAKAYDKKSVELFGEFARTNF